MYVNLSNVSSTAFSMCPPSFLTAFACTERGPDKAQDGRAPAAGCSATPRTPRVPCSEQPSRRMGRCEIPGEAPRSHGGHVGHAALRLRPGARDPPRQPRPRGATGRARSVLAATTVPRCCVPSPAEAPGTAQGTACPQFTLSRQFCGSLVRRLSSKFPIEIEPTIPVP